MDLLFNLKCPLNQLMLVVPVNKQLSFQGLNMHQAKLQWSL